MASALGGEKKLLWSGEPVEERLYRDPKKLGPVPHLYRIVIDIFFEHAEVVIARPATNDNS